MVDRRRNDTKKRLTALALEDITKNGYQNFSQREIARLFGISNTAFYMHFKNRDGLLSEALALASQNLYTLYQEKYAAEIERQNPLDAVVLCGQFLHAMFREQPRLMGFIFYSPTAFAVYAKDEEFDSPAFPLLRELFSPIDALIREYALKIERKALVLKLWSFLYGYILLDSAVTVECAGSVFREIILDIIAGDRARQAGGN